METNKLYDNKTNSINLTIEALKDERKELKEKQATSKVKSGIEKWVGFTFQSSSMKTPEFSAFAKDFKKNLLEQIKKDFELVDWSVGHFEVSVFIQDKQSKKFIYLSISDVRFFRDGWFDNVLIRTAKHAKDYTGGSNSYCKFENINKQALYLIEHN